MCVTIFRQAVLAVFVAILAVVPARAVAKDLAGAIVQAVVEHLDEQKLVAKSRRMSALGPWLGGSALWDTKRGAVRGQWNVGLGLYFFSDPLLEIGTLKERIQERVMERLTAETRARYQRVDDATKERIFRELADAIKADFRALFEAGVSPWPKALFALTGDVGGGAAGTQMRVGLGVGIGRFTIGPTIGLDFGDSYAALLGPELGTSILVGEGPRPWLVNLFARYEFHVLAGGRTESLNVGARVLLDLI